MKTSNLRQLIRESLFELISEGLCAKGKAYSAVDTANPLTHSDSHEANEPTFKSFSKVI